MHAADLVTRPHAVTRPPAARQRTARFSGTMPVPHAGQMHAKPLVIGGIVSLIMWSILLSPFFI